MSGVQMVNALVLHWKCAACCAAFNIDCKTCFDIADSSNGVFCDQVASVLLGLSGETYTISLEISLT